MDKEMWHIQIIEYHLAIRRNEDLIQVATWVNLKTFCKMKKINLKGHILYNLIYMYYPDYTKLYKENKLVIARDWRKDGI